MEMTQNIMRFSR